jgi:transcriptional regulator with XRE-family HTH domain
MIGASKPGVDSVVERPATPRRLHKFVWHLARRFETIDGESRRMIRGAAEGAAMNARVVRKGNAVELPPKEQLIEWREHKGLSPERAAKCAGVSADTYGRWESGARRSCFRRNLKSLADGYGVGVAELWEHPVSRVVEGEPIETLIRRVLLGTGREAAEYVAYCAVGGRSKVYVTEAVSEKRLKALLDLYRLGSTPEQQVTAWRKCAERMPRLIGQLNESGRALGQGQLKRVVLDYAKGGVFWSEIDSAAYLVVATLDEPSMAAQRAHAFVRELERVVGEHALRRGRTVTPPPRG